MKRRIEAAGYVPIAVDSFDSVKVVEPMPTGISQATMNAMSRAAFEVLNGMSDHDAAKQKFCKSILTILLKP